jgi:hypothetical protein
MNKRMSFALAITLLSCMLLSAIRQAWAQESTSQSATAKPQEKSSKEQSPPEKGKTEQAVSDSQMNFPQAGGPVELRAPRGVRITLKLEESSAAVYQAIGSQAKISVLFDPDYVPRNISVDIKNASLEDALKIVAFQSRTFWRPVTSDSIFVTQDTQVKRRDFEQQVLKTYYLPNIATPADLQDTVNAMRSIIEVVRIQQMPSYQTITVRATQNQIALIDRLLDDLKLAKEKTGGQYRIEFKVTEGAEDQKSAARTYAMLIDPREGGKLRIGQKVPILTKDQERTYTDVGKNIDCAVRSESEHSVTVRLALEFSEIPTDGNATSAHGDPVIQRVSVETYVTLELGRPTIVGNFQDPVSKRSFQIEATATRTKSKE